MSDFGGGTQFEFTYAPGVSAEQIVGFEMAGEIWSSYLADDVTVRIHIESTGELPDEVIGAALPGKKRERKYVKVYDALRQDITSGDDQTAFANLPSMGRRFSVFVDGQELKRTKKFRINDANAKALGLLSDDSKQLDGYIVVNDLSGTSTVGWDYDALRSDSIQGNEIDFLSVAMHEVGHVLGFVSGIDDSDWLKVLTEARENDDGDGKKLRNRDFKFVSPLDLYRYSDSTPAEGQIDLSFGGNPFFSIDGGNTKLGTFANGQYTDFGGDGYQASHWQQFSSQGIMDPVLPVGLRKDISNLDLTSMDVIGWDINTATASWDEMYANAVADAEVAVIENRDQDVEEMIQESNYDARRPRGDESDIYAWQIGLWQYTTLDSTDVSEVVPMDEFVAETDVDDTENNSIDNQPDLAESSTVDKDLSTDDDETAINDGSTIVDVYNTENNSIDNQAESTESSNDNDLSSNSEVTPTDETETNNEDTEDDISDDQTESPEISFNNQDSDVEVSFVNLDDSVITSDYDANNLDISPTDNQSDLNEPADDYNYSSDFESIFENENVNSIERENESILVNYSDNYSELSDDDDDVENYWDSSQSYWYVQDFSQFATGVIYYDVEQDSLIEYW